MPEPSSSVIHSRREPRKIRCSTSLIVRDPDSSKQKSKPSASKSSDHLLLDDWHANCQQIFSALDATTPATEFRVSSIS